MRPGGLLLVAFGVAGCGPNAIDAVELGPSRRSLVAYWNFDEGQGAVVHDRSGHNRNGRLTGGTWTTAGRFAGALRLNRGDHVTVENFPDATPGWTVSAWMRFAPTDFGLDWGTVVSTENLRAGGWELHAQTERAIPRVDFGFFRDVPSTRYGYAEIECCPLEPDRWFHIVAVVDPLARRALLYEGGLERTAVDIPGGILPGDATLYMGRWNEGHPNEKRRFNGVLDEIAIYERALTPSEIAALERGPQQ